MSNLVHISETTIQHVQGIRTCFDVVGKEGKYIAIVKGPALPDLHRFIMTNRYANYPQYVATIKSQVIGWCNIIPKDDPVSKHVGVVGMGLLPEHRGQGYGSVMLQTAIQAAWRYGLRRIELDVYSTNEPAIALYRKLGFKTEGVSKDGAHLMKEGYVDVIRMALLNTSNGNAITYQVSEATG